MKESWLFFRFDGKNLNATSSGPVLLGLRWILITVAPLWGNLGSPKKHGGRWGLKTRMIFSCLKLPAVEGVRNPIIGRCEWIWYDVIGPTLSFGQSGIFGSKNWPEIIVLELWLMTVLDPSGIFNFCFSENRCFWIDANFSQQRSPKIIRILFYSKPSLWVSCHAIQGKTGNVVFVVGWMPSLCRAEHGWPAHGLGWWRCLGTGWNHRSSVTGGSQGPMWSMDVGKLKTFLKSCWILVGFGRLLEGFFFGGFK